MNYEERNNFREKFLPSNGNGRNINNLRKEEVRD